MIGENAMKGGERKGGRGGGKPIKEGSGGTRESQCNEGKREERERRERH